MGIANKRPPLPAPTDSLVDFGGPNDPTDAATDLSVRTDRSHYSLPDDGTPIKISTKKLFSGKNTAGGSNSQTSLLIECLDRSKAGEEPGTRASVRVRVTPSARKMSTGDSVKIAEAGKDRQPSFSQRVSTGRNKLSEKPEASRAITSDVSDSSPVKGELFNRSDVSSEAGPQSQYIEPGSTISSIPPDSLLDGPVKIRSPKKKSFDLEVDKVELQKIVASGGLAKDTLQEPLLQRSRSKSRERIAQKVIEKLNQDREAERLRETYRLQKLKEKGGSREVFDEDPKVRSKRSSRSYKDSDTRSDIESSLLRPQDRDSSVSGGSKVSLNNPKLLQTVEDAIRRIILPEIETIKRQQSINQSRSRRARDSFTSEDTASRTDESELSRPKVVLNRDGDDPGLTLSGDTIKRKHRHRSSRGHGSEKASSREGASKEQDRERRHRHRSSRDSKRDSEEAGSRDHRRREHRRRQSESRSRTDSILSTEDEYYEKIPPMPMRSEIQDSDLTRESLLSAETHETDTAAGSLLSEDAETPLKTVSKGFPQTLHVSESGPNTRELSTSRDAKGPRMTRSRGELSLNSSRSDRSLSDKARTAKLAAAGITGAAAALYGHDKVRERSSRRSTSSESKQSRQYLNDSPRQSSSSLRQRSHDQSRNLASTETAMPKPGLSPEPLHIRKQSADSQQSNISAQYPPTSKRHQAISLEEPSEVLEQTRPKGEVRETTENDDRDVDDVYQDQHKLDDEYRSSADYESQRNSIPIDQLRQLDSPEENYEDRFPNKDGAYGPQVQHVAANPGYVDSPVGVESAVASLVEPSIASSDVSRDKRLSTWSYPETASEGRDIASSSNAREAARDSSVPVYDPNSKTRWSALLENAKALSNSSKELLDEGSASRDLIKPADSVESLEQDQNTTIPAVGRVPNFADRMPPRSPTLTDPSADHNAPSVIEGPLGDASEQRGHWPYEPTPSPQSLGYQEVNDGNIHNREFAPSHTRNAAVLEGGAGMAGLGIGAMHDEADERNREVPFQENQADGFTSSQDRFPQQPNGSKQDYTVSQQQRYYQQNRDMPPTPMKDEGYISAHAPVSSDTGTPLSFSKPPPRLFDDTKGAPSPGFSDDDPFISNKRNTYASANSHGMPNQYYDAATGRGMNHIESKDVVALMDHLTVRDGHRNAVDTEILCTLVMLTTEMQNNFVDMKKVVEDHSNIIQDRTEQAANRLSEKVLGDSSRGLSSVGPSRTISRATDDTPAKRKNIFKRAFQGLKSKSTTDLTNMEAMMQQLLFEVEKIKDSQGRLASMAPSLPQNSLDSYERLRVAPDSGYEPDGQAGTSSTPSRSVRGGTISPQVRNAQQPVPSQASATRMHSGYYSNRESGNRISTVLEDDEDQGTLNEQDEEGDGMQTPTQEAQEQRARSYNTPQHASGDRAVEFTPDTNMSGENRSRHKSNNAWTAGIPRISRWSKTTTSSEIPDDQDFGTPGRNRPYSDASRSGSEVNVIPQRNVPYAPPSDERLRSITSLNREFEARENEELHSQTQEQRGQGQGEVRSASPLIPDTSVTSASFMDDPKYRAQRNSLTLEHPQPRQGPTRHPSNLEDQAYTYRESHHGLTTPDSDAFGSNPSLARYPGRFGSAMYGAGGNLSPISSDGGASQRQSTAPQRPSRLRDDGPLVPPKIPNDSNRGVAGRTDGSRNVSGGNYQAPLESNSPESPHESYRSAGSAGDDYYYYRSGRDDQQIQQQGTRGETHEYSAYDEATDEEEDEEDAEWQRDPGYNPIPLERRRSPYSPGGLLDPIEERYSMEGDRSSVGMPHTSGLEDVAEEVERTLTPDLPNRGAVRTASGNILGQGEVKGPSQGQAGQRRVSGPREMPGRGSSSANATARSMN